MLERPTDERQLPVRLCDVKPRVRLSAARSVAAREPGWAHEVFAVALAPSRTVYYVAESALPILLTVIA